MVTIFININTSLPLYRGSKVTITNNTVTAATVDTIRYFD